MSGESDEQRKDTIAALLREREGAEKRADKDHMAQIDAELRRVRNEAKPKSKRAQTRVK